MTTSVLCIETEHFRVEKSTDTARTLTANQQMYVEGILINWPPTGI